MQLVLEKKHGRGRRVDWLVQCAHICLTLLSCHFTCLKLVLIHLLALKKQTHSLGITLNPVLLLELREHLWPGMPFPNFAWRASSGPFWRTYFCPCAGHILNKLLEHAVSRTTFQKHVETATSVESCCY